MKRITCLCVLVVLAFSTTCFASKIRRISLSELQAKANLIVMAKVTKVVAEGDTDHVTIKVDSYLKGESLQTVYTFTLVTRGGLKDFDPSLKKGDSGVFFLKRKKQEGKVEKAYWGSVATFPKNHFDLTEEEKKASPKTTKTKIPKKIKSFLMMKLGMSSTGSIQVVGNYSLTHDCKLGKKTDEVMHLIQQDQFGRRLFWSCLVNLTQEKVQVLYRREKPDDFGTIMTIDEEDF